MLRQAQIQPQTNSTPGFDVDDHMNASCMAGFQPSSTPVSSSHAKVLDDLRKQVEFYFGPSNYPNDAYLQQLAATYGGAVPIVVILGFPKVREIFTSATPLKHATMTPQQAEIQLLAMALENSEYVKLSQDWMWIFAPSHHPNQMMHHHQPYGMTVPVPQHQQNKASIHSPYSVMSLHHSGMMFANAASMPYGHVAQPQYPTHSLQMDHPQHLLPRSMPPFPTHTNGSNTHHHNPHNHHKQHNQAGPQQNRQYQRCHSQGSNKSEGHSNNTNNHNHNKDKNNKNGKRKKNRRSFTGNSIASTSSGGSGGGASGSEKRSDQQGPLERQQSSNSSFDNNSNTNNSFKGSGYTANNNTKQNNNKTKKRQSFNNKKDKKKQPGQAGGGGGGGGGGGRSSSSNNNKSSEILSDENFPSLPCGGQKKKKEYYLLDGSGGEKKSAQPYAQALLKSATGVPSSEDSTVTTVNTLNTEIEKLAIDTAQDDKEEW